MLKTSSRQPATSNRQPATGNQQPATSNQPPATTDSLASSLIHGIIEQATYPFRSGLHLHMVVRHFLVRLSLTILCGTGAWAQQYTISTIAGTGTSGFTGDGGSATSAELATPVRIILDSSGKIYIADGVNDRIRVISS